MLNSQKLPLVNIKRLAKKDLESMDSVIKSRLSTKEKLVQDVTYHIIKSGGKRLRPVLTILSAKLFGYDNGQRHVNLAAAVEFIHTATLLHDDVVDQSKLRRGSPTANKNWDNKSSILVGDFLFSQAFLLMSEDNDLTALAILSRASSIIAEGEVKQLSSITNLDLNIDEYLQIISAKTAELFAASCQVGTCIATNNKATQLSMYNFGLNLGMAFQIIDDILDYVANQNALGKNIGDDFKEGKVTLPIIIAYSLSDVEERKFWQRSISDFNQTEEDFNVALDIFSKYAVIDKCMDIAMEFTKKAKDYISIAPDNQIKSSLVKILDFSTNRKF
jgi:octaprenyl-diphosphate synthase